MITAVGIGPWGRDALTLEALEVISSADCLIGSDRQLEGVKDLCKGRINTYTTLSDLCGQLDNHEGKSYVVLASGDPSFYGIAKYLCDKFGKSAVRIVSGISSVQYLFSKAKLDMNDIYMTSGHGRPINMDKVMAMDKTAILTDGKLGPFQIAQMVLSYEEDPQMVIGESLGAENERITFANASQVEDREYDINVVIIDRREGVNGNER